MSTVFLMTYEYFKMLMDKEFLTFKCRMGNKYVIYSKNSYYV
jgi:hypothetical protein